MVHDSERPVTPSFPTESQADREGQVIANAQQVDVTVLRFEVDVATSEREKFERIRVLRPQQPSVGD